MKLKCNQCGEEIVLTGPMIDARDLICGKCGWYVFVLVGNVTARGKAKPRAIVDKWPQE